MIIFLFIFLETVFYGVELKFEMEIPSNYPEKKPTLKCLTPITSHPCIQKDGQVAVCGRASQIITAFNLNKGDLLTALSKIVGVKGERIRGREIGRFDANKFNQEKHLFYARWTPDRFFFDFFYFIFIVHCKKKRASYFPVNVNISVFFLLLCHNYHKSHGTNTGIGMIGKCPRVVVLLIAGEFGRSYFNNPKSFTYNSLISSLYQKKGNCILN